MTVDIRIANNDDAKEWDTIISQSSQGTLFHTWNWLKIAEKHTNMKLFPLIVMKDNIPIGLFPLFFQRKGPLRMVFSPPPHVAIPYLGPVLIGYDTLYQEKRENIYIEFLNSINNFISNELKANYIRISLPPALHDPRPFNWSGYFIEPDYDFTVDLSQGIENLFKSLNNRQRADLKRAKENGMTVKIGTKKDFEKILNLLDIRYAEQTKIVTESKEYFLDIYDIFKENIKIFIVLFEGEVVTGGIRLQYRDSLYGWVGNPRPKNRISPSPNHLLLCESIRYASEHEFKYYTIMGAAGNKRLYNFYAERFNPELKLRFSAIKRTFLTGILEKGYSDIFKPGLGKIKHLRKLK
jgi:hypothetical protein